MKKFLLSLFSVGLVYLILELSVSTLHAKGILFPVNTSLWVFEDSGKTLQFDPIRGYKLTSEPSRFAKITFGEIEYIGTLRGNAQGFPDRDDFLPIRRNSRTLRIAVFGDSFTAAQYLDKNWPDAVEDLTRQQNIDLELLNFSIDGAGLANWWSVFKQIVYAENYQIDGLLFAVYQGNLRRRFSVSDDQGSQQHLFGRTPWWDPQQWPKTLEQARPYLRPAESSFILSPSDFNLALQGQWLPSSSRTWRFFIATQSLLFAKKITRQTRTALGRFFRLFFPRPPSTPETIFELKQKELIEQIAHIARQKQLPTIVVRVPSIEECIHKTPPPKDVVFFASMLNATLIDGTQAFEGLTEASLREHFLPYDGHWNQRGSDRFAEFMFRILQQIQLKR